MRLRSLNGNKTELKFNMSRLKEWAKITIEDSSLNMSFGSGIESDLNSIWGHFAFVNIFSKNFA